MDIIEKLFLAASYLTKIEYISTIYKYLVRQIS